MKNIIIQRKLDELGRVAIPIEFRKKLGIHRNEDVMVYVSDPNREGTFTIDTDSKEPNAVIQAVLGFLILPQTYRYSNGLIHCMIDIWVEDEKLRLKKTIPQCLITGDTENLVQYKNTNKYISKQIIKELYENF